MKDAMLPHRSAVVRYTVSPRSGALIETDAFELLAVASGAGACVRLIWSQSEAAYDFEISLFRGMSTNRGSPLYFRRSAYASRLACTRMLQNSAERGPRSCRSYPRGPAHSCWMFNISS